jgi:hypothetical protein
MKIKMDVRGSKTPLIPGYGKCVKEQRVDGYSLCIRLPPRGVRWQALLEYLLKNRG